MPLIHSGKAREPRVNNEDWGDIHAISQVSHLVEPLAPGRHGEGAGDDDDGASRARREFWTNICGTFEILRPLHWHWVDIISTQGGTD